MIEPQHKLSLRKQAQLLDVNRNRLTPAKHKLSRD